MRTEICKGACDGFCQNVCLDEARTCEKTSHSVLKAIGMAVAADLIVLYSIYLIAA